MGFVVGSMRVRLEVSRGGAAMEMGPHAPPSRQRWSDLLKGAAIACGRERGFSRARFRDKTKSACFAAAFTSVGFGRRSLLPFQAFRRKSRYLRVYQTD